MFKCAKTNLFKFLQRKDFKTIFVFAICNSFLDICFGRITFLSNKTRNFLTLCHHQIFFWYWLVSLFKFSYWSKFHDNTITGSAVMIVDFYKVLTRNSKIGYTPDWVLPNMWRLGQVRNTKFGMNLSNKMLLHAAKYQGYSFYCFWVINSIQNEGGGAKRTPLPVLSL